MSPFRFLTVVAVLAALPAPVWAQLTTTGNQVWAQGFSGLPGRAQDDDQFGFEIVSGDFNGDFIADVAVGSPGDDDGRNRGAVHVIYGADGGPTAVGSQQWFQGPGGLGDDDENGDTLGAGLAAGDFNNDGFDELAIGIPGEDGAKGAVQVLIGSANGLTALGSQTWDQGDLEGDGRDDGDQFGLELTVGDFNGDGFQDLAVGSPGENSSGGLVNVIYGSAGGLTASGNQRWRQGADDIEGSRDGGDFFGGAVATGDLNGDGYDELVVSALGEDSSRGDVHVIFGSAGGLVSAGNQRWRQGQDGLPDDRESGDGHGSVLAVGDFNADGYGDIAASALGENSGAGVVLIIPGSASGPTSDGSVRFRQEDGGVADQRENGDRFGSALAAGDFNFDGIDDLAVGVRGEDSNRGIVQVFHGSGAGLGVENQQLFAEGFEGLQSQALTGDNFGFALAAGDVGQDFATDLIVGSPGDSDGRAQGIIHVLFGIQAEGEAPPLLSSVVGAGLSVPAVNSMSFNSINTAFGANFAPEGFSVIVGSSDLVAGRLPTILGGVCLEIDGRRAPLFAVFPGQINFQALTTIGVSTAQAQVVINCGQGNELLSNPFEITVADASPEFFFFTAPNQDGTRPIAAINASIGGFVGPVGLIPGAVFEPALPGEVVTVFVTGLGETTPRFDPGELPDAAARSIRSVQVLVNGIPATVSYAGVTPGNAGLYQVSFTIPLGTPAGNITVRITSGDPFSAVSTPDGAAMAVGP